MKFLILFISFFSFILTYAQELELKTLHKNTAALNPNLYISKYEVSNGDYNTFRRSLKASGKMDMHEMTRVDSLLWRSKSAYNEPYVLHYTQLPGFQDYPVVAISYEAAIAYCRWLTESYNSYKKRKFEKVKFRLPTKEEWVIAVQAGNKDAIYPWEGDSVFRENGACRANFKREPQAYENLAFTNEAEVLAPVASYWPNEWDIYNLSGNAAEMLQEQGTTAGGAWITRAEYLSINSPDYFADRYAPNTAIGFRWVMEIIKE